ncbi:phosphatase PAP2 family protein [Streptomyces sp. MUM 203J]|uniref:phosphatase PAP2 family protein n=1 Tax=Streptomyces sp. MUM 203J TaxID=2791990 RepID=UPI001F032E2F|nr:phosphatase PAP2 family protein [Streptomyces sp. MUM 203J]MCH0538511.1 phosphatase PAP2 family protein [Streptomyces sp. MUM 203J]
MAGLASNGSNPDVGLLHDINGLARSAPAWFDRVMEFVGEYGILLGLVLVVVWCWWSVRRRGTLEEAAGGVAAVAWAPLAAGIAVLVNVPIRGFVERPRPFLEHDRIEVLVDGKTDFSFVSDHATVAMALGVGLFVAHKRAGLAAIGLAFVEGFCRVYMGVHYPTDVVGGFALGTAVALLLAPVALALLTRLFTAVGMSGRGGRIVRSRRAGAVEAGPHDLAA